VGSKGSRAAQQRIYKSGFAMVYVRHKGDIAQIIRLLCHLLGVMLKSRMWLI
jgi:hypothetical protein